MIAAGFYLVYMLFSFAQPFLQKALSKDKIAEEKIISIEEISSEINEESIYDFEEQCVDEFFTTQQDDINSGLVPECFEQTSPPGIGLFFHQLSFSLFSRPPPAC